MDIFNTFRHEHSSHHLLRTLIPSNPDKDPYASCTWVRWIISDWKLCVCYYSGVTRVSCLIKSPATRLFVQLLVHQWNRQSSISLALCEGNPPVIVGFPHTERDSMLWRHHDPHPFQLPYGITRDEYAYSTNINLTHWSLEMPYDDIELGHQWLR